MISVSIEPRVKIRCQFKTIPGVTWINLAFEDGRGQRFFCTIAPYGGVNVWLTLDEEELNSIWEDKFVGQLSLLKSDVAKEIASAIKEGMHSLRAMIKGAKNASSSS